MDAFLERVTELSDDEISTEDEVEASSMSWFIGEQERHGQIKGVSRSSGTLQKDWTIIKADEFTSGFVLQ